MIEFKMLIVLWLPGGGPARIMNMSSYARYDIIISEQ